MEDFESHPDDEIKARSAKTEPNLFLWKNYTVDKSEFYLRRLLSILFIGGIFGITVALL